MPLRDFVDQEGIEWRVWSVAIDQIYSQGVRAGFLGVLQDGWLCFEAPTERRRLAGYPLNWFEMSDDELVELLARATPVPRRRSSEVDLGEV
jgi:hypothetical protein